MLPVKSQGWLDPENMKPTGQVINLEMGGFLWHVGEWGMDECQADHSPHDHT